jgi:hypothetical protein
MRSPQGLGHAVFLSLAILATCEARSQDATAAVKRDVPWLPTDAIRLPDKNDQIAMQEQKSKKQSYEMANAARRKQIADDTVRLLQLATELKAEIDSANKETLSADVIRKADTIEKLAHGLKEKMKLTVF